MSLRLLAALLLILPGCNTADPEPPRAHYKPLEFALLEDYDKGDDLERIASDFRYLHELGIDTWRGSFGWDDYEPEPGRYDLEWLRSFVALAEREGIRLRPYLAYTPEWAATGGSDSVAWNDPPRDLSAWRRYVQRLATEFRDSPAVLSWEIYNEQNAKSWWDGTAGQYAAALIEGAAAVRAADADAQVVMGGLTYPDVAWLEAVCETHGAARAFDIAAIHAYPETWTASDVTVENYLRREYPREFLGTLQRGCAGQPVWINEAGFATAAGRTEEQQAGWWVRAIATFAADSAVQHIGIYELRDLRAEVEALGEPENYHLGLRRADDTPKLAFHTVRMLVHLLGDRIAVLDHEFLPVGNDGMSDSEVEAHLFQRPDGTRVLIAWTRGRARTVRALLPPGTGRGIRLTLRGDSLPLARPEPGDPLELRLEPDQPIVLRFGG